MAVGLCCRTSALYSRSVRLSVLLLGILTDIAMCALFFELSPPEEEQSFYFWDELQENVWVGLYSALFSIPPLLAVVFAFKVPSAALKAFAAATSPSSIQPLYK